MELDSAAPGAGSDSGPDSILEQISQSPANDDTNDTRAFVAYSQIVDPHSAVKLRYEEAQKPLWERNVLYLAGEIRSKPNWWSKYKDETILGKWKQEVVEMCTKETPQSNPWYKFLGDQIDETFEAITGELEYDNALKDLTWPFVPGVTRDIFYADRIIPQETKSRLQSLVSKHLEDCPAEQIDWHPGSDGKVRDLVHPSLYPLKYGFTLGYHSDGSLRPIEKPERLSERGIGILHGLHSGSSFQWLPSVFRIEKDQSTETANGYKVTIDSYINNLHPQIHKEIYTVIEEVFAAALPGLNYVLSNAQELDPSRSQLPDIDDVVTDEYKNLVKECEQSGDYDGYDKLFESKNLYLKPFSTLGWRPLDMPPEINTSFRAENYGSLKVITKLANIELTPDSPEYNGGSWHLEGTSAENIIATVLYYYDSENITQSRLSFRASIDDEMGNIDYEQDDVHGVYFAYGLGRGIPCINNLGSMSCIEDRIMVFPNMLQHHVDAFKLANPLKPGHRKILCFFICDPGSKHVWATDKVPYQNQEWVRQAFAAAQNNNVPGNRLEKLPVELQDRIFYEMGLMTSQMAEKEREELMKERGMGSILDNRYFRADRDYSLCEH